MSEEATDYDDIKMGVRHKYNGTKLIDLAKAMKTISNTKERLELALKEINAEYDVLRLELIPSKMDEEGIQNIRIEGIGRLSLTADAYVSLDASKKEEFYQWLAENNLGDLIQQTINSSTLKAFAKDRTKKGEPLPGAVRFTPFTRASITKA